MLYLFYRDHPILKGEFVETRCTSAPYLSYPMISKGDAPSLRLFTEIVKQIIPVSRRNYDPTSKIWTISSEDFQRLQFYTKGMVDEGALVIVAKDWEALPHAQKPIEPPVMSAEEFFYETPPTTLVAPPKASLEESLFLLLEPVGVSKGSLPGLSSQELRSFYRKASRLYHPDLNGGDSSKMTELNYVYQTYTRN